MCGCVKKETVMDGRGEAKGRGKKAWHPHGHGAKKSPPRMSSSVRVED